jgi:hypothetical protein
MHTALGCSVVAVKSTENFRLVALHALAMGRVHPAGVGPGKVKHFATKGLQITGLLLL